MTDSLISPEQQAVLDYLAQKRIQYEDAVAHGRERKRGKFLEYAWKHINGSNALMRLPITMFTGSRSGVQQGFDRVILGTFNKDGSVKTAGIRPNSDYRVMEHDDGEFILLNLNDERAWDEYELWLVSKMGIPAFDSEYSIGPDAASITRELDNATRDLEVASTTK